MNKVLLSILVGTLTISIQGCSLFSNVSDLKEKSEENLIDPTKTAVNNTSDKSENKTEELAAETTEEKPDPNPKVSGLIPATNPDLRVRSSIRGRQDPFAIISVKPKIEIIKKDSPVVEEKPFSRSVSLPSIPTLNRSTPASPIPTSQPPAQATLANGVVISGLIKVNGEVKIIVTAPEETSSRYVGVGQYLSNGQILVKRIEADRQTPLVILEESGIEVAKSVGEKSSEDRNSISSLPGNTSWLSNVLSQTSKKTGIH
jgi:type II secretory pathway component PulC